MHSTLALTLAFVVVGTQPESIPAPPAYEAIPLAGGGELPHHHGGGGPLPQFAYPNGHPYPDVTPHGLYGPKTCGWSYPNGICGHHCVHDPHSWKNWWFAPGNMLPHYAYLPAEHGYFYFEPYNVTRVHLQQSFVASYGGDIRHPYENSVFDQAEKIYKRRHPEDVAEEETIDDLPDETPDDDVDLSPP